MRKNDRLSGFEEIHLEEQDPGEKPRWEGLGNPEN